MEQARPSRFSSVAPSSLCFLTKQQKQNVSFLGWVCKPKAAKCYIAPSVRAYNLLFFGGIKILQGNIVSIVCRKVDFDAYMESWRAIATTDGSEGSLPITMRLSPVAFEVPA